MKELIKKEGPIGGDGGMYSAAAVLENKALKVKVEASYPLEKVIQPVTKVVDDMLDKLESAIPGDWDKKIIEGLKADYKAKLVELMGAE